MEINNSFSFVSSLFCRPVEQMLRHSHFCSSFKDPAAPKTRLVQHYVEWGRGGVIYGDDQGREHLEPSAETAVTNTASCRSYA